jgi:hypothetical protein
MPISPEFKCLKMEAVFSSGMIGLPGVIIQKAKKKN